MENKKETVSNIINLPEDLHKRLKIEAITKNKSLHDVMVENIEKGINVPIVPEQTSSELLSQPSH